MLSDLRRSRSRRKRRRMQSIRGRRITRLSWGTFRISYWQSSNRRPTSECFQLNICIVSEIGNQKPELIQLEIRLPSTIGTKQYRINTHRAEPMAIAHQIAIFLRIAGPMSCLYISQGLSVKWRRPIGGGRQGSVLGSSLPEPILFFSAYSIVVISIRIRT